MIGKSSLPIRKVVIFAAASLALLSSKAQACDQADAEDKIAQAESAGIMLGVGMLNNIPTLDVDPSTWDGML